VRRLRARLNRNPRAVATYERALRLVNRVSVPLRRGYYLEGRGGSAVRRLPAAARRLLGLDDPSAVGSRRIEIGGGFYAQPGYIHVDVLPGAAHLELRARAESLPFPDGWAEEVLAVHMLEHVHPSKLRDTLREWHRVLAPGGRVRVHVPNSPELFEAFLSKPPDGKWAAMGALLGMWATAATSEPEQLRWPAEHQIVFDKPLLRAVLEEAGFADVTDLTEQVVDRHTAGWAELVPHCSLVAEATKPGERT